MRRWKAISALVFVLLVSTTGCLRAEVGLTVNDDRSGSVEVSLLINKASLDSAGISPDQLEDVVDEAAKQISGATVSTIDDRGDRGVRVTIPFDDYQQAIDALSTATFRGQPLHIFQSMQITSSDDGSWSMRAAADPSGIQTVLAELPKAAPVPPLDPEDAEITFAVTLPGRVAFSNAFSVDGGTAMWKLTGTDSVTELNVQNEPGALTNLQKVLIGAAGLLAAGFVLLLVTAARGGKSKQWTKRPRRRRRQTTDRTEQWQPRQQEPGTLGGRDESDLPAMGSETARSLSASASVGTSSMGPPPMMPQAQWPAPPVTAPVASGQSADSVGAALPPVFSTGHTPVGEPAPHPNLAPVVIEPEPQSPFPGPLPAP